MAARSTTYDYTHDSHQSYKCSLEGWHEDRQSARLFFRQVVNGIPVASLGMEPRLIPTDGHHSLLEMADDMAASRLSGDERLASLLKRLQHNRDHAASIFSEKVDVSHFEYNGSETKFAEYWSDPEGYVLRNAELKSKRKETRGQDA